MKNTLIIFIVFLISFNQIKHLLYSENNNTIVEIKETIKDKYTNIVGTVYHLEAKQCDSNPYETADGTNLKGKNINKLRYVALSRDLIKDRYRDKLHNIKGQWKGKIHFGDTIRVISDNNKINGLWIVKDVMNKRFKNKIDFMQDKNGGFYGKFEDLTIELI